MNSSLLRWCTSGMRSKTLSGGTVSFPIQIGPSQRSGWSHSRRRPARLAPSSAAERYRWLFDDWTPDIGISVGDDYNAYERELERAREAAVGRIIEAEGFDRLVQLSTEVRMPSAVGFAAARVDQAHDGDALEQLDSSDTARAAFADAFARSRFERQMSQVAPWLGRLEGRPLAQARLLQTAEDVTQAWKALTDLDPEVDAAYWAEFVPYGRGADFPHTAEVVRRLLLHGRAAMAVDALGLYIERLEGENAERRRSRCSDAVWVERSRLGARFGTRPISATRLLAFTRR